MEGSNACQSPVLEMMADDDEDRRLDRDNMITHYANILQVKDSFEGRNQGTDQARSYRARLGFSRDAEVRRGLLRQMRLEAQPETHEFLIVDGRGGDLAPNEYGRSIQRDEVFMKRRAEYRDALIRSTGLVICLTIAPSEYDSTMGARLLEEFRLACELKQTAKQGQPFRHIALCLTKYETVMHGDGNKAGVAARDREVFLDIAHRSAGVGQFAELLKRGRAGGDYRAAVFPVSTYGFVEGTGAVNLYDYPAAPGLRTRAVSAYDYDNADLPDYRDHFPDPITQTQALTMWQPFNLAPPLLYALTGVLTGPMHATIEDFETA
jgi:hypothetical protein